MNNTIIYLENYVETTAGLPPELTRILATVKDLDDRSQELSDKIQHKVDMCLLKPPRSSLRPGTEQEEVEHLLLQIEQDQRMLVQWAEEKLSLACIMADLLDMHVLQLDKDLQGLESELEGGDMEADIGMEAILTAEEERRRRQRQQEVERDIKEAKRREREAQEAERRRALANSASVSSAKLAMSTSSQPAPTPNNTAAPSSRVLKAPGSSGPPAFFPSSSGHPVQNGRREKLEQSLPTFGTELNSKRKAAQAAVHAAAQALAQEDGLDEEMMGIEEAAPAPYMPTLPPGMQTSASSPQAAGRLLTFADISEGLRGRRAELFWPDDNLWYLIEIHDLDLAAQRAQIMYVTGETEELDLGEIVREGHMSLINI